MDDLIVERQIWEDMDNDKVETKDLIFEPKSFANEHGPLLLENY